LAEHEKGRGPVGTRVEGISENKGCGQEHLERVSPGHLLLCEVSAPFDIRQTLKRLLEVWPHVQQRIVCCLADQVRRIASGEEHEGLPN
jgi:hypothetical protein